MGGQAGDERSPPAIGVFGGTFDPLHTGHLIIASELRYALALDRVLFIPAGRPPHKADQTISDDDHRLAMLRLALADAPGFDVSTIDLDRAGPSYTAETLGLLRKRFEASRLVFLMGEDSLRDLPSWRTPGLVVQLAELGVATRPKVDVDLSAVYASVPEARGRVHLVEVPEIAISSSELRQRAADGRPLRYLVPRAVEEYIREHGLYRFVAKPVTV